MRELSGDNLQGIINRVIYTFYNFIRGMLGYGCFLKSKYWHPNQIGKESGSPGRKYLNQYLLSELPKIKKVSKVNILDLGCGSGYIRNILSRLGYCGEYDGVDIKKNINFDKFNKRCFKNTFIKSEAEKVKSQKKYDIIFTITSLEHMKNDFLVINKCNNLLKKNGSQVHIIPSFYLLFLFFGHGYRQYYPCRIKGLFKSKNYKIDRLGGLFSYLLHFFYITIPLIFFKTKTKQNSNVYNTLVHISNYFDKFMPIFSYLYVVVVKRNNNL